MSLNNCKRCGRLYMAQKTSLCDECQAVEDEYYRQVRSFVQLHPGSTVMEIHEKTGIPLKVLLDMNRSENMLSAK